VEAPGDAAGGEPDEAEREDDHERVREHREHLAGEDLTAVAGASEDRLQRVVVALRRDDVARDERGDQRQAPDRHEEKDDERGREPVSRMYLPSGTSFGPPVWRTSTTTKTIGTRIAEIRPR
jgi:hypothetical protein